MNIIHRIFKFKYFIVIIIFSGIIIRCFVYNVYLVSSYSMLPTLKKGNVVLVDKLAFLSRFSNYGPKKGKSMRVLSKCNIERNDIVVFKRSNSKAINPSEITHNDIFVKRCIGISGDTVQIENGITSINGVAEIQNSVKFSYVIKTGNSFNMQILEKYDAFPIEIDTYRISLTKKEKKYIKTLQGVKSLKLSINKEYNPAVIPWDFTYKWNEDNLGPIIIPKKGNNIILNRKNYILYKTVLVFHENNKIDFLDGAILVNGKPKKKYTFKQNYYFMLGDNRHASEDSRFWGFVPENHIIGKVVLVI
jgi:signal peptidase I